MKINKKLAHVVVAANKDKTVMIAERLDEAKYLTPVIKEFKVIEKVKK